MNTASIHRDALLFRRVSKILAFRHQRLEEWAEIIGIMPEDVLLTTLNDSNLPQRVTASYQMPDSMSKLRDGLAVAGLIISDQIIRGHVSDVAAVISENNKLGITWNKYINIRFPGRLACCPNTIELADLLQSDFRIKKIGQRGFLARYTVFVLRNGIQIPIARGVVACMLEKPRKTKTFKVPKHPSRRSIYLGPLATP